VEPFDPVEETLDKVAFSVERPVNEAVLAPCWISFDMRGCAQIIGDESAQMIGIIQHPAFTLNHFVPPMSREHEVRQGIGGSSLRRGALSRRYPLA